MNKKTLYLSLIVLTFFFSGKALAQENTEALASPANSISAGPPLEVKIKNANFDESKRELSLTAEIKNNSGTFIDNVDYSIELYKGDKLAEEGLLFQDLELMAVGSGPAEALAVDEKSEKTFKYTPPTGIESGEYFIRFILSDKETVFFGIDYTPTSIYLSGQGGFLGSLLMNFRTSYGDYPSMSGNAAEKTENVALIFPLDEKVNSKLAQRLKAGEKMSAKIKILSLAMNQKLVKEFDISELIITQEEKDGVVKNIVKIELFPWEKMSAGSYDVVVNILDSNKKDLSGDLYARWLISGFFARIKKVSTQTNFYEKGDALDLAVEVVGHDAKEGQKISAEVIFNKEISADNLILKKDFTLKEGENTLSFSDLRFLRKLEAKSLDLSIKDGETGEILDTYKMDFAKTEARKSPPKGVSQNWLKIITVSILILIFILSMFLIVKKYKGRGSSIGIIIILLLLVAVYFWLGGIDKAEATCLCGCVQDAINRGIVPSTICVMSGDDYQCHLWAKSTTSVWFQPAPPSGDMCPGRVCATAYSQVTCTDCMNGMPGSVSFSGLGGGSWSFTYTYSTDTHASTIQGPYTSCATLNAGQALTYSASAISEDGCWCPDSSASTPSYTVRGKAVVNGACGSANGGTFATAPAANLCSAGTASPATPVVAAGKWDWDCVGSCGTTANCSANVSVPTPVTTFTGTYGTQVKQTTLNLPSGGGNITLDWSVTNAIGGSCTGYSTTNVPGWATTGTGGKPVTGVNVPANITKNTRFDLDCWSAAGTPAARKSVYVNLGPPDPVSDCKANNFALTNTAKDWSNSRIDCQAMGVDWDMATVDSSNWALARTFNTTQDYWIKNVPDSSAFYIGGSGVTAAKCSNELTWPEPAKGLKIQSYLSNRCIGDLPKDGLFKALCCGPPLPPPVTTFTGTYGTQVKQTTLNLPPGGGNITLDWSVTNAIGGSCTGYSTTNVPGWATTGTGGKPVTGVNVPANITKNTRFDLDCWSAAGTPAARKSVDVIVNSDPVTTFTGTYDTQVKQTTLNLPDGGGDITLDWSVTNAVGGNCTGYSTTNVPGWATTGTGGKSVTGVNVPANITTNTRFDLDCWNAAGTPAQRESVDVIVCDCGDPSLHCAGESYQDSCANPGACTGTGSGTDLWSGCSRNCGGGTRTLSNSCTGTKGTEACNTQPCLPGYKEVAPW